MFCHLQQGKMKLAYYPPFLPVDVTQAVCCLQLCLWLTYFLVSHTLISTTWNGKFYCRPTLLLCVIHI